MRIGIISNENHAKSHKKALRGEGHDVVMLGGNPNKLPTNLDILICRKVSTSHGGYNLAKQADGYPVVFLNGVTEIVSHVRAMKATPKASVGAAVPGRVSLKELVQALGVYSHHMHDSKAGPVIEWLAGLRGEEGLILWKRYMKQQKNVDRLRDQLRRAPSGQTTLAWSVPARGGVRRAYLWSVDQSLVPAILEKLGLYSTEKEAKAEQKRRSNEVAKKRAAAEKERRHKRYLREKAEREAAEKAAAAKRAAAAPKRAAPPPPPPKPVAKPVLAPPKPQAVAPVSKGLEASGDGNIKTALNLLLNEMKEAGFQEITVNADGKVSFKRIVVQVGELSLTGA